VIHPRESPDRSSYSGRLVTAGDVPADADLTLNDEVQPVAVLALAKDVRSGREVFFTTDIGHPIQLVAIEVFENHNLLEQLGDSRHALSLPVVGESLGEATGPVLC
jgi:hypothetical protein